MSKCTDRGGCAVDGLFNTGAVAGVGIALLMCAFGRRGSARCRRGSLTVVVVVVSALGIGTCAASGSCGGENGDAENGDDFAPMENAVSDSMFSSLIRRMRRNRGSRIFSRVGILLRSSL